MRAPLNDIHAAELGSNFILMSHWKLYPRLALFAALLTGMLAGVFAPALVQVSAAPKNQATMDLIISEVAWAGTKASSDDEWIELYNPGASPVTIDGWRLVTSDGSIDFFFPTLTSIPAGGFLFLERTHEGVTNVTHDLFYSGALSDAGTILRLRKPDGTIVDTANADGGFWPAGGGGNSASMERVLTGSWPSQSINPDAIGGWVTFDNNVFIAQDAAFNNIYGTPKDINWGFSVTATNTPTITLTPSITNTPTRTPVPPTVTGTRPTSTRTPTQIPPNLTLIINEVAWMGTNSSALDEWIELYNSTDQSIDLKGWVLRTDDASFYVEWTESSIVPPFGYYLMENEDDTTVLNIAADKIYVGRLDDTGGILRLYKPDPQVTQNKILVDVVNSNGGSWPAGRLDTRTPPTNHRSMERTNLFPPSNPVWDSDAVWATFMGTTFNGKNSANQDIFGSPKSKNWVSNVTLTPSRTPTATSRFSPTPTIRARTATPTPLGAKPVGRPFINEFLPRPGFDWNLDGRVDVFDEFIEIKNVGNADLDLNGWRIDDSADFPGSPSSSPYTIQGIILKPGEYAVFYGLETNILLSDGGDSVRLFDESGTIMDVIDYTIAKVADKSVCRLPDGNGFGSWYNDCSPTPNLTNARGETVPVAPGEGGSSQSASCNLPDTLPADFLFAECGGYGSGIWNDFYWNEFGWQSAQFIPDLLSKWRSFIE